MKKYLTLLAALWLTSCSSDEEAQRDTNVGCDCVEKLEFATSVDNFSTWTEFALRPTQFSCAANGYSEIYKHFYNASTGSWVKNRFTVVCN